MIQPRFWANPVIVPKKTGENTALFKPSFSMATIKSVSGPPEIHPFYNAATTTEILTRRLQEEQVEAPDDSSIPSDAM